MDRIVFDYDFNDLRAILSMPDGRLDFRFENYPHNDISVETKVWSNIQEFLEWYHERRTEESVATPQGEREKE